MRDIVNKMTLSVFFKSLKSKTINFGLILVLLGYLELDKTIIPKLFPDGDTSLIYSIIGLIIILLRYTTNKPIKEK